MCLPGASASEGYNFYSLTLRRFAQDMPWPALLRPIIVKHVYQGLTKELFTGTGIEMIATDEGIDHLHRSSS